MANTHASTINEGKKYGPIFRHIYLRMTVDRPGLASRLSVLSPDTQHGTNRNEF